MVSSIGIDSIEISRFSNWHTFPHAQLRKIFSETEIAYCLKSPSLAPQRFAVRFAAKEAFFKAFCAAHPNDYRPFLTICKSISVEKGNNNIPLLQVDWHFLGLRASLEPLLSLTHTKTIASAIIFLKKFPN